MLLAVPTFRERNVDVRGGGGRQRASHETFHPGDMKRGSDARSAASINAIVALETGESHSATSNNVEEQSCRDQLGVLRRDDSIMQTALSMNRDEISSCAPRYFPIDRSRSSRRREQGDPRRGSVKYRFRIR